VCSVYDDRNNNRKKTEKECGDGGECSSAVHSVARRRDVIADALRSNNSQMNRIDSVQSRAAASVGRDDLLYTYGWRII